MEISSSRYDGCLAYKAHTSIQPCGVGTMKIHRNARRRGTARQRRERERREHNDNDKDNFVLTRMRHKQKPFYHAALAWKNFKTNNEIRYF
jgi:hypothetical protein